MAFLGNITNSKREESIPKERELWIETLIANIPGAIYSRAYDADWTIEFISDAIADISGYPASDFIHSQVRTFASIIHPADRKKVEKIMSENLDKGQPYILEYRINHADGGIKWVYEKGQGVFSHSGELLFLDGAILDITERKLAELALQESEYRYYTLAKMSPVGIYRTNAEGDCLYVNEQWCENTGLTTGEAIGKSWTTAIYPLDRERVLAEWHQAVRENLRFRSKYRFQRPDGTIVWVLGQAVPEIGSCTEVIGYVGTVTEIGDLHSYSSANRKQMQEELRQSETRNLALLNLIPDLTIRFGRDGTILEFNAAKDGCTQTFPGTAIGKKVGEIFPPEVAKLGMFYLERTLSTGEMQTWEYQLNINGNLCHREARTVPCGENEVLAIIRDISATRQVEAALRKSEYKLSLHVQQTPLAVIEFNLNFDIVEWNPAAEAIFGYSKHEIVGRSGWLLVPESARNQVSNTWEGMLTQKEGIRSTNENITKDGKIIICEWHNTILVTEDDSIIGVACFAEDITHRMQAEQAIRHQAEQERLVAKIAQRIHQSLNLEEILNTATREVQQLLACDRVIIYRIWPEGTGSVITEALVPGWPPILGRDFSEEVFPEHCHDVYKHGRIRVISDLEENVPACLVNVLRPYEVKAEMVVPIVQEEKLWGLLIVHQCSSTREWQQFEINLLQPLATQLAIAIHQALLVEQLEAANQELQRLACLDGLTQVANRRHFDEYLEREWRRMTREQTPLALILCDIDYFKLYNDTYGHPAGDLCLQKVANAIQRVLKRPADIVARYGGEEFAIILPNTKAQGALTVAQEIRSQVAALQLRHQKSQVSQYVTLSLGVAVTIPNQKFSVQHLISTADIGLYEAKSQGRDRVVLKTCR